MLLLSPGGGGTSELSCLPGKAQLRQGEHERAPPKKKGGEFRSGDSAFLKYQGPLRKPHAPSMWAHLASLATSPLCKLLIAVAAGVGGSPARAIVCRDWCWAMLTFLQGEPGAHSFASQKHRQAAHRMSMQHVTTLTVATTTMVTTPTAMPILEKAYGTGRMVLWEESGSTSSTSRGQQGCWLVPVLCR